MELNTQKEDRGREEGGGRHYYLLNKRAEAQMPDNLDSPDSLDSLTLFATAVT